MKGSASIHSIFNLVYYVIMMQLVLYTSTGKIATGAIHSGVLYRTGIQYRMHVNTTLDRVSVVFEAVIS